MEGILKFLLNEKDYRSILLRKYFHFVLIPMVNPDGVHEGMFRTDLNGFNLNRYYSLCEAEEQYFCCYIENLFGASLDIFNLSRRSISFSICMPILPLRDFLFMVTLLMIFRIKSKLSFLANWWSTTVHILKI